MAIGLVAFVTLMGTRVFADKPESIQFHLQAATPSPPAQTLTSTPIPSSTPNPFPSQTPLLPLQAPLTTVYAFIQAPAVRVSSPYVILSAFSPIPQPVTIRGLVNSLEFNCPRSPCLMALESSARFVFRAYTESGASSDEVIATVNVLPDGTGYLVTINVVSQFTTFRDSCSLAWDVQDQAGATWDSFVQFPYEINTRKTLHTLAAHLILNGIVDSSACPAGGLNLSLDWPTACGLESATPKMIEWQNQYDEYIWLASREHGIPPKVLKTLIEIESQFWPGNSRFYLDEFGLGQINQLGVDVLLRRDAAFYRQVCSTVLSDCNVPYPSLDPSQQALIRGAAVSLADATCSTCPNGLDLDKAKESISLIAMLLRANCEQVEVILDSADRKFGDPDADAATATAAVATARASGETYQSVSYEDLWRFTFVSYHSGSNCFQEAVNATRKAHLSVTWENLLEEFNCKGGVGYADGFINSLDTFDLYLYQPADLGFANAVPTYVPTRTPIPTPTIFASKASIMVQVYVDQNGNGSPDVDEWIDAMTVLVTTSDNNQLTQRTHNGIAIFDMSGFAPGINVTVSLPGLYRSESFSLPEQGEVVIMFRFELPALPTNLP
jgi:hypothetical protein